MDTVDPDMGARRPCSRCRGMVPLREWVWYPGPLQAGGWMHLVCGFFVIVPREGEQESGVGV